MGDAIILRDLWKRYASGGVWAVREVNLAVREGEIFSLLGPNGAGKTTLIAILGGLFPPTRGEAIVAGRNVVSDPLGVKQIIGVVPEEVALYPQLSARQNLHYFGQLYGLQGRALGQAIEETLAIVGLVGHEDKKAGRYSSGMKRRLNIAAALLHGPRLLLMDEPTVGLDPESRRRILDLVLRLKQERATTILYTTHYMDEAEAISDRVGIVHAGRLIAVGAPGELIASLQTGETIALHVGATPVADGLLDALRRLPGVNQVAPAGEMIRLSVRRASDTLPALLRLTTGTDGQPPLLDVRSLTVARPRLEDVFLQLTGEAGERSPS